MTPTQHLTFAHPMGNTQIVDLAYQHICLIAKAATIQENLAGDEELIIYEFTKLLYVLNVGLATDEFEEVNDMDFDGIITKIELRYAG